eukprot:CAMPEP_0175038726 /NCGR_PEP_ID=MMETSP0052_2-20121109/40_1 /TAXON_ID=51329 ORGANISM="Polytomella parva, Strain SAG 63-3" /NCGR_SAMPLE_ID=MMETSP0052_2 /ASSEMBLY_ACC=CAM_ASM_000194 /LENGTH=290 /DNA_ID=CAMNT_0016300203 /DNA_START=125 /DNA_END=997 /DNA_ORIENTATION=+
MIRDRTADFRKIREEERRAISFTHIKADDSTIPLISDTLVSHMGSGANNPAWVSKAEKIRIDLKFLKEALGTLEGWQSKALLVTFDSNNDAKNQTEQVTIKVKKMVKDLEVEITNFEKLATSKDDVQVIMEVKKQLAQALYTLSIQFRKNQMSFLNKVEQQKGLEQGSSLGMLEEIEEGMDSGFTQDQIAMVDNTSALIAERDAEIQKIVQSIGELAQIMKDLHTLVVEQGTILDRIDRNIQDASIKVDEGVKVLKQTEKTQKAGRMMLCIIGLIVLIVIMLIFVIIRHS